MHIHTLLLLRAVTDQYDSNTQFSGNVSLLVGDALALPLLDVDSEGGLEVDSGLRVEAVASGISSVDDVTVENGAVKHSCRMLSTKHRQYGKGIQRILLPSTATLRFKNAKTY